MTHNEFLKKIQDLIKEWRSKDFADYGMISERNIGREDGCIECSNELQYYFNEYFISNKTGKVEE